MAPLDCCLPLFYKVTTGQRLNMVLRHHCSSLSFLWEVLFNIYWIFRKPAKRALCWCGERMISHLRGSLCTSTNYRVLLWLAFNKGFCGDAFEDEQWVEETDGIDGTGRWWRDSYQLAGEWQQSGGAKVRLGLWSDLCVRLLWSLTCARVLHKGDNM